MTFYSLLSPLYCSLRLCRSGRSRIRTCDPYHVKPSVSFPKTCGNPVFFQSNACCYHFNRTQQNSAIFECFRAIGVEVGYSFGLGCTPIEDSRAKI